MKIDQIMFFFAMLSFVMGIVFLIYFRTAARKNPYLIGFVIGKLLQGTGIVLTALKFEVAALSSPWLASIFITVGLSLEVIVFISYDLIFNKKIFQIILALCSAGVIGVLFSINTSDSQIIFCFNLALGGVFLTGAWSLFKKNSPSRLARVTTYSFIIYGLIWIYAAIHALVIGEELDMLGERNHARMLLNLSTLFNFVIVSLGYTMLQKEMDEQRIKEDAKIIQEDNTKLKQLNETKDQFFSIIAHDLRGPIGGLAQLGELLSGEDDSMKKEDREHLIQLIAETSKNSFILLENLLLWARSESGELQVKKEDIQIKELFENTLILLGAPIKQKNIKINLDVDTKLTVSADQAMLSTVFRNLISNAIKFVNKGGHIRLSAGVNQETEQVCMRFEDDGIGIPENKIKDLLSLDSRFTSLGTQKETGSGLGLKLCNQFIQKMEGSIKIESKPMQGSSFCICLPLED